MSIIDQFIRNHATFFVFVIGLGVGHVSGVVFFILMEAYTRDKERDKGPYER